MAIGKVRQTHQWLRPLWDYLDGRVPQTQIGSPTGAIGLYGATGYGRLAPTGVNGGGAGWFSGATGLGAPIGPSGSFMYNGGTGTFFGNNDIVRALKNCGILPL